MQKYMFSIHVLQLAELTHNTFYTTIHPCNSYGQKQVLIQQKLKKFHSISEQRSQRERKRERDKDKNILVQLRNNFLHCFNSNISSDASAIENCFLILFTLNTLKICKLSEHISHTSSGKKCLDIHIYNQDHTEFSFFLFQLYMNYTFTFKMPEIIFQIIYK